MHGKICCPPARIFDYQAKNKNAHTDGLDVRSIESSSLVCRRIWHLSIYQVAGFHRAVPSTALDKASMQFVIILQENPKKSRHFSSKSYPIVYKSDIDFLNLSC